jgi:DNA-directed RNA polymerase subunit H (RpoH/RPB5)
MSSTSQNQILQVYNSRKNILEIMNQVYSYDINDYDGFSTNEIDTMLSNNQLDMILTKTSQQSSQTIHKTYIHYSFKDNSENKYNPVTKLNQVIEDLFILSNTLSKEDCLIMIYDGEPNDTLISYLEQLYQNDHIFVVVMNIKRLQFNILNHVLVPKIEIISNDDVEELKKKHHIKQLTELPEISRFDPQALAICLRPGNVCKFFRKSPTAMETDYYRFCV